MMQTTNNNPSAVSGAVTPSEFGNHDLPYSAQSRRKTGLLPRTNLLERIRALQNSVGDGLNDLELTCLLRSLPLAPEDGFSLLSYSEGFVTFGVPFQDVAHWYPDKGRVSPAKARFAQSIAEKHGLTLCEPPDLSSIYLFPRRDTPVLHHHLEMSNLLEVVVLIHPRYLKVRIHGAAEATKYLVDQKAAVPLRAELLRDLSVLYQ